jgi:ectoine hydroxylase-related dioxygenase (phytanoyl-CoA dioxygenase family)
MSYVTDYREKGIAVIPNVFSEEECNELKRQAYSVKDGDIKAAGYTHSASETIYNKKSLIFFPALANEYINQLRIDDRMQEIVKEFIGNDVKQINNQIYFREAGDQDQFAWHRDTIFRESNNFTADVETDYLQTIIAVDDIHEDNGAVEFIEGSHHWEDFPKPRNLRVFDRGNLKGAKYTAKKGSVLLWSVMIVHGSDSNFSNADRMTYMNGFCKARATPTYPPYMIDGKVIERIDPRLIP